MFHQESLAWGSVVFVVVAKSFNTGVTNSYIYKHLGAYFSSGGVEVNVRGVRIVKCVCVCVCVCDILGNEMGTDMGLLTLSWLRAGHEIDPVRISF